MSTEGHISRISRQNLDALGPRILTRAVVVEVINDLSVYNNIQRYHFSSTLRNDQYFDACPRNSIIATIISDGEQRSGNDREPNILCYPLFPPHMCLPLKPGEQVWLIHERGRYVGKDKSNDHRTEIYYWMCRVTGPNHVDDLNFTHIDRELYQDGTTQEEGILDNEGNGPPLNIGDTAPTFENGIDTPNRDMQTLSTDTFPDGYYDIFRHSVALQSFTHEAVPRFTKRPGDMVIQGSNNTLICLGEERGWNATNNEKIDEWVHSDSSTLNPDSLWLDGIEPNLDPNDRSYSGAIDIVAGRGRYQQKNEEDDPSLSACRKIVNELEVEEVNKNPVQSKGLEDSLYGNIYDNPTEGDPDLLHDASRVYVSMRTSPDLLLGLSYPDVPVVGEDNSGVEVEGASGAAAVIVRSDEIRIVARQTEEGVPTDSTPEIKGSIKIIKEGVLDSEEGDGQASIILQPDGVIMIDGPKVVIGSGIQKDNGEGAQISLGLAAEEPIVLGNKLTEKLEAFMDAVMDAFQYAATHVHPTGVGPSGPPTGEQWSAKKSAISTTKGELSEFLSTIGKTL